MRHVSPGMEEIIDKEFKVLDHGFIRVIDYLGNDDLICEAARNSFGKGTKTVQDNENLIRYLLRHQHTTPFEFCEIILQIKCPMDVWRQQIRHRTASVNEYSTRYSIAITDKKRTKPNEWRPQSKNKKQGSEDNAQLFTTFDDSVKAIQLCDDEVKLHKHAHEVYQRRLDYGVAREQARKDLPLSTYTMAYWKMDLHNLLHYLSLRMDSHAQWEIRQYANIIGEKIVSKWVPITWAAFNDYDRRRDAILLTKRETEILAQLLTSDKINSYIENNQNSTITGMSKWERDEFFEKLKKMK
ncbi:MAG: FAD-dependent thymidylate synthase [Candidatus Heimdallarchaeaceae archaeon]